VPVATAHKEVRIALLLSLLRLGFCAWRAAGQSITGDEAITFRRYVDAPWSSLWSAYDANNHILHSILAKLSAAVTVRPGRCSGWRPRPR